MARECDVTLCPGPATPPAREGTGGAGLYAPRGDVFPREGRTAIVMATHVRAARTLGLSPGALEGGAARFFPGVRGPGAGSLRPFFSCQARSWVVGVVTSAAPLPGG
jgi:hypothetical protein